MKQFTVCIRDPRAGHCQRPYHDTGDINGGGPHDAQDADAAINNGKMNGFIELAEKYDRGCCLRTMALEQGAAG